MKRKAPHPRKELLSATEAAEYARVHVNTIRKWVEAGVLKPKAWTPSGRPRFDPDDLYRPHAPESL